MPPTYVPGVLYRTLRAIAALAIRWYYRRVEVVGADRIPAHGPVLLVANHWNALVDPLLVATSIERPVRLTAKATLLDHPITRLLLRLTGVIPLRRTSDEQPRGDGPVDASRNQEAFAAVLDALQARQLILIFPEGKSHSEPALAPLKTGCARLALLARFERGLGNIPIIPIGITFEAKDRVRSRVVLQVGEPVTAHDFPSAEPDAVRTLTARIDAALRNVTLNFASRDDALRIVQVSSALTSVLDHVRPLDAPEPPLAHQLRVAQRLETLRKLLADAPPSVTADAERLLADLDALRDELRAHQIPINEVWMSVSVAAGVRFLVREAAIFVPLLPMALWGRVNHWMPLALARRVGRATSANPDEPAMHTLVSGLAFVLAFYILVAALVGWRFGSLGAVAYLVALPPTASLDFWLSDRWHRARRRARAYRVLRRDPHLRTTLRQRASDIRAEARRLDRELG